MHRGIGVVLVVGVVGCVSMEFHPDHPDHRYPQTVKVASRIPHSNAGCESIGTLTFFGDAEESVSAVAERVAEVGGTHYTVRVNYGPASLRTHGTATRFGAVTFVNTNTTVERNSSSVIDVLICDGTADYLDRASARERHRPGDSTVSAQLAAIRQNPKVPELGATRAEAKVICERERGLWVDKDDKVGCKVGGAVVFACAADELKMTRCTTYYEGAELTDWKERTIERLGAPESETISENGFRVFEWANGTTSLTMYERGVELTVSNKE